MSHLVTAPDMLATAAAHVDEIASTLRAANAAAAGPTCNLLAAAGDEVSAATAALFSAYGREYQAVVKQAAAFHSEFTRTLEAAGNAYAHAEAANAARVSHALDTINAPIRTLLGRAPLSPNGSSGAGGLPAIAQLAAESPITALIMGGTNNPLPDPEYVTDINKAFIQTLFPGAVSQGLFTPEQFWPVTPDLGNLTFNQSVTEGVALLNTAVNNQLALDNKVVAFGYSQSATIINNYINSLMAMGSPNPDDISFVMIGSGNNPVGGLLARFPGFYIPFLDVPFNGATPANSPYPTHIYTAQYDGIAHAPQFPLRILSDINAFMGYFYVHNTYPELMATQVDNAVPLPTSPGYTGNTQYYMFLTQDLPLLQPIRDIPYAGPPDRRPVPAAAAGARRLGLRRLRAGRQLRGYPHSGRAVLDPQPVRCHVLPDQREPAGALWRHRGDWGGSRIDWAGVVPGQLSVGPVDKPGPEFLLRPATGDTAIPDEWRSRQHPAPDPATGLHLTRPR